MFSHDERLQRLWDLTGGWPMLVEHAATLADSEGAQEPTALDELKAYVNSPTGHSDLLDGVGLTHDPDLARAYASIVALVDDQKVSWADLQVAADMDGSARDVVERLLALQVFDTHGDGSFSVEARLLAGVADLTCDAVSQCGHAAGQPAILDSWSDSPVLLHSTSTAIRPDLQVSPV